MNYIMKALENNTISINSKTGIYHNKDGIPVPRVTEILSKMIHSDALMYWANSLGFKGLKYRDVLNKAASFGTISHNAIERFLKEKLHTDDNAPFLGFLMWYNIVTKDKGIPIEVIFIEHKLTCKWFGGTLDALLKIGSKIFLVDFKTSNYVTYKYFLQLAAYKFMLREENRISVDGVIVLQLDKDTPGFNEYLLDFTNIEHKYFIDQCENTFLSLVYAYYNIYQTERLYKYIF